MVTPLVFQKMEVREPSGTDGGTAQMSTFDVIAEVVVAGAGVGGFCTGGFGRGVCVSIMVGVFGAGAGGGPT